MWTSSVFKAHPGFTPMETYEGYSGKSKFGLKQEDRSGLTFDPSGLHEGRTLRGPRWILGHPSSNRWAQKLVSLRCQRSPALADLN